MGAFGTGGFYSAPHPERIGSPTSEGPVYESGQSQNQAQPAAEEKPQARPIIPPYLRNWENSAASFAPDAGVSDPNMQPELAELPQNNMGHIPLIAAGLFALWILFKGDR